MPNSIDVIIWPEKQQISVPTGVRVIHCLKQINKKVDPNIAAVRVNNEYFSLMDPIAISSELKPVYFNEEAGSRIYRDSLVFVFEFAVRSLYPDQKAVIGHSLDQSSFYRFQDSGLAVSSRIAQEVEEAMWEISARDLPIEPGLMSWKEALAYFAGRSTGQLVQEKNDSHVPIWRCGDFIALRHSPLVMSTGVLKIFAVEFYQEVLLLRFPSVEKPDILPVRHEQPKLYAVYKEHKRWGEILRVPNVASLNALSRNSEDARDFILSAEALHDRKIAEIGGMIADRSKNIKAIMIAGPSSSGKTTFTKKLSLSLKSSGLSPVLISLDDYYLERPNIPKDEQGKPNFEILEALDIPLFNQNLSDLLAGKEVETPIFDFKKAGGRLPRGRMLRLEENNILLYEGIHALNPSLIRILDEDSVFRIYISALTALNIDDHVRIATTDNRLIRRIVRDHQFRRYTALQTLKIWPSVRRGEEENIFPWDSSADIMFNSALDYEIAVLKVFAEPLLGTVTPDEFEYGEARRLINLLRNFFPFPIEEVPSFSILREFIGHSGFHY
ncbi:MAG: hypothetical protein B0D92_01355 [Spirochaeta sp. LUC14_002_19_P3]|nr:MAG: hypothetical protein B0D92_01355 [Spirochaeta sp. LUC14_002_19_P3]